MHKGDSDVKTTSDSIPVTLALPKDVHRILTKQAGNMGLQLEEFIAGLVDLGYETLEADGGARSYK